ncbi:hypothetical protein E2562_033739 [Oryza meyeriana var. granulata]|uniref:Uncharacterized protein n=1 Tax=Oryza meyeriana var. granulata TaxID=110450 RepID=A0A6G1E6K1_9ORYZ|nr:hypothetical protein E2562_033739 [Oryza meyeriana var. granulata]
MADAGVVMSGAICDDDGSRRSSGWGLGSARLGYVVAQHGKEDECAGMHGSTETGWGGSVGHSGVRRLGRLLGRPAWVSSLGGKDGRRWGGIAGPSWPSGLGREGRERQGGAGWGQTGLGQMKKGREGWRECGLGSG